MTAINPKIEAVRGGMSDRRREELLRFWAARGALEGEAARGRLAEVVCHARDEHGAKQVRLFLPAAHGATHRVAEALGAHQLAS